MELVIAEANMEYYLDDTVTNETLAQYLAKKFSAYTTGSGAEITFLDDGTIQYEASNGNVILLEMQENGKVEVTKKADGTKILRTVTYDANGGTGVPATQNAERKATVNVDFSTTPTREGYAFLGWATTNTATSAQYTQNGTNAFTMGTSNITLYAVWQDVLIGADNYGDVANYSANGVEDWKVFLNDGSNIYLIASDFVPNSGLNCSPEIIKHGLSCVYSNVSRDAFINWLTEPDYWTNYSNGFNGAVAIGGPTFEQFIKSYNEKYKTDYSDSVDQINEWTLTNVNDLLYTAKDNVLWLSSAWIGEPGAIWVVGPYTHGLVYHGDYERTYCGVRPLVRLPEGIMSVKESDGKWTFSK